MRAERYVTSSLHSWTKKEKMLRLFKMIAATEENMKRNDWKHQRKLDYNEDINE